MSKYIEVSMKALALIGVFSALPAFAASDVKGATTKVKDAKVKDAKVKSTKVKDAKVKDIKAKNTKVKDAKVKDIKAKNTKVKDAKVKNAKIKSPEVKNTNVRGVDSLKGITIGVDLAYNYSSAKHDKLERSVNVPGVGTVVDRQKVDSIVKEARCNFDPSINIGYSYFNNNWYVGAAGEVSFGKRGSQVTDLGQGVTLETRISGFAGGIKAKGGYYIDQIKSVAYLTAGVKWRSVSLQQCVGESKGSKANLSTPLFALGVGIETPVYKKVSFSAEYEYAWRNSTDDSVTDIAYLGDKAVVKMKADQHLHDNSFKVGFKYHI